MFTNTPQADPIAAAGRPEACVLHRAHDRACGQQIGMGCRRDRRVNLIREQVSLQHPDFLHLRLGEFVRLLDKCVEMSLLEGLRETPQGLGEAGKLRGRSVCYYNRFGGIFKRRMDIRFDPGGTSRFRRHAFARAGPRDGVRAVGA